MIVGFYYFWGRWKMNWNASEVSRPMWLKTLGVATVATGVVGFGLKKIIEKVFLGGPDAEIEQLFGNLTLVSIALFAAGILIMIAGRRSVFAQKISIRSAGIIGVVQGLCLPFRGFSRSGATISSGLMLGWPKNISEDFSFALAVILTPPVVLRELMRLIKAHSLHQVLDSGMLLPGLLGMALSFGSGLLALRWLSRWIEHGKWAWFGYYCIAASVLVFALSCSGY